MPFSPGKTLERYTIEAMIGRGGMGEVYVAMDTRLRRKVALKVVREDKDQPEAGLRLLREARAAGALSHPNVVAVYDVRDADNVLFIVMELIKGKSLLDHVRSGRTIPTTRKVGWLLQVARALACAHGVGIVHRDVKPSNVMITDESVVKVVDFGLAKPLDPTSFRTQGNGPLGTPSYMAPELLEGREPTPHCDQYAFGVSAYQLLSGSHPGNALAAEPELLSEVAHDVSRDVALVVARALARDPRDRFAAMSDVVTALERIESGQPLSLEVTARPDPDTTLRDPDTTLPSATDDDRAHQPTTPAPLPPTLASIEATKDETPPADDVPSTKSASSDEAIPVPFGERGSTKPLAPVVRASSPRVSASPVVLRPVVAPGPHPRATAATGGASREWGGPILAAILAVVAVGIVVAAIAIVYALFAEP